MSSFFSFHPKLLIIFHWLKKMNTKKTKLYKALTSFGLQKEADEVNLLFNKISSDGTSGTIDSAKYMGAFLTLLESLKMLAPKKEDEKKDKGFDAIKNTEEDKFNSLSTTEESILNSSNEANKPGFNNMGHSSISIPSAKSGPLVLFIPGIDGQHVNWIPSWVTQKALVVHPFNFKVSWDQINSDIEKAAADYTITEKYVIAYSAGGLTLLSNGLGQDWRKIILADPSIPERSSVNLSNIIMFYNPENWGQYPELKSRFEPFAEKIKQSGGKAERITVYHGKFVPIAFDALKSFL